MMTKIETQAMDAVIDIHRETKKANEPDQGQRWYEIVKEIFLHKVKTSLNNVKDDVESAIEWADLLVSKLKKEE